VQYSDTTMVFTEIGLKSKDGSLFVRKWVKYCVSSSDSRIRAAVTEGYPNEYTLWWPATALPHRWLAFDLSLPKVVSHTWGKHGWVYESLEAIRIRGSLSISPIRLIYSGKSH